MLVYFRDDIQETVSQFEKEHDPNARYASYGFTKGLYPN